MCLALRKAARAFRVRAEGVAFLNLCRRLRSVYRRVENDALGVLVRAGLRSYGGDA